MLFRSKVTLIMPTGNTSIDLPQNLLLILASDKCTCERVHVQCMCACRREEGEEYSILIDKQKDIEYIYMSCLAWLYFPKKIDLQIIFN